METDKKELLEKSQKTTNQIIQKTPIEEKVKEKGESKSVEEKGSAVAVKEKEELKAVKEKNNTVAVKENEELKKEERKYNNYEKNQKVKTTSKSHKKVAIIISLIIVILAILGATFCTIFALINSKSDTIIEGISINGIEVAGLTKEEAKEKIEKVCNEKLKNEINIKYEDYESTINLELLEVNYKVDEAVEEAFNIGREGNIVQNNFAILKSKYDKKDIALDVELNDEDTLKILNDISANIPGYVVESSYYIEDNNLIVTKGKTGLVVDSEALLKLVYEDLSTLEVNQDYMTIPVIEKEPEAIDIDKIHEEVYKEAQDAYYTTDPFTIYPEVDGIDFDVEEAKKLLEEDKEEYTIKLNITKAQKTIDSIGTEAFPDLLGTCSTNYNTSQTARTTNLRLASNKINGKVLLPGEEFSYNQTVGERTIEAGYKEAPIFSGGKVVDGLGGGICQISSTLYDAVVYANLDITERRNHQFVTSYLAAGLDATVVWGSQDFKFKNTRSYPIKIVSSVEGGVAKVSIYGMKEETEYDISIETNKISTIPYTTTYQENSSLAAGTEKVTQNGSNGSVVEAYKVTKLNGTVISRTLLSKDTYNAKQKIVERGTASSTTTSTSTSTTTTTNTTTTTPATTTTTPSSTESTSTTSTTVTVEQPTETTTQSTTEATPSEASTSVENSSENNSSEQTTE